MPDKPFGLFGLGATAAPPTYARQIVNSLANVPNALAQALRGNAVGTADPNNPVSDMARQAFWRGSVFGVPQDVQERNQARALGVALTFGGPMAKTADTAAMARALQMHGQGVPKEKIWDETGWFKGPEGKWKFEIDDSAAKWATNFPESKLAKVGELIDHQNLDAAYPDVMGISSAVERSPSLNGSYSPSDALRYGRESIAVSAPDRQVAKSGFLHELQHAIQRREDFATGGNPEAMAIPRDQAMARVNFLNSELSRLAKEMDKTSGPAKDSLRAEYEAAMAEKLSVWDQSTKNPYDQYKRLAGEAEARAVQARMNLTPAQRQATPPWASYDVPWDKLIVR